MKKVGVFLARMQPIHNAHLYMVEKACEECDEVTVILGSENKRDTLRNPFTIEKRREMLLASLPVEYREKISVYEIPDWSMESKVADYKIWGRYFYYNAVSRINQKRFFLYYSDGQKMLDNWFENTEVREYITYRLFERSSLFDGLSATKIRNAFVNDDKEYIRKYCPDVVLEQFDYLKKYYLGVLNNPLDDYEMEWFKCKRGT